MKMLAGLTAAAVMLSAWSITSSFAQNSKCMEKCQNKGLRNCQTACAGKK